MTLPAKNIATIAPMVGLILIGWIVEVFGLYFLQKSCHKHATPAWAAAAGFPAVGTCWKMYRFEWATILFELVCVLGLMFTLTSELQSLLADLTCHMTRHLLLTFVFRVLRGVDTHALVFGLLYVFAVSVACEDVQNPNACGHAVQRPMPLGDTACHSWVCWPLAPSCTSSLPTAHSTCKTLSQRRPSCLTLSTLVPASPVDLLPLELPLLLR